MMSTLKGFLGDDADEKIKKAMEMLSAGGENKPDLPEKITPSLTPESLEMLSQLKSMADSITSTNDSRSELLRSLRPFVRAERQKSIDKAIRLINIGRFSGLIGR